VSLGNVVASVLLLAANGFFVAAEFALLAARRSKVEQLAEEGVLGAKSARAGLRDLSVMLAAAQLGITMASLGLGAVAEPAVAGGIERLLGLTALPEGAVHAIGFALALALVVFLHMVVGEMAPKSWAISDPERSALRLAPPFRAFTVALSPAIRLLNWCANAVVKLAGVQPRNEIAVSHNARDLAMLVTESGQHGLIEGGELDLLTRALEVSGLDAEAVMVPRGDVVAVDAATGLDELEDLAARSGRSRLVVYDDELDRIRGVLHVKDLLSVGSRREQVTAASLARPALLTPESRGVEDLMLDMRQAEQHIAVVVDEYGSVTGLVTLEDLLEELVGDVEDESDRRRRGVRRRADGGWSVPGSLRPDELDAAIGFCLPNGEWETIAGYVISELDRLPEVGDTVRAHNRELRVTRLDHHRVLEVRVSQPDSPSGDLVGS
jgi:CBS domain containing-hemolysin-like protein